MSGIVAITMPKWGLAMTEGEVTQWLKSPGEVFKEGDDLVDIETSKMTNVIEAPFSGRVARIVVHPGAKVPVGGLLAISAPADVAESALDAFIADFQSSFVPETEDGGIKEGMEVRYVEADGRRYRAGIVGDLASAPPIVLIHGFSGDINNWALVMPALAARRPVASIELPGHGASDKNLSSGSLWELAGVVRTVLAGLGINRCTLVGHSLGGAVALAVTATEPTLAETVVLLAPAGLPGSELNEAFISGIISAQSARQLKPILSLLFTSPDFVTRDMVEDMLKFKRVDGSEEALAKISDAMRRGADFAELARRLEALPPITIILGASDAIVSPPDRSALPACWEVKTLTSGHMPHIEASSEVASLILAALLPGA